MTTTPTESDVLRQAREALPAISPHDHPEHHSMVWTQLEIAWIKDYATTAALAAIDALPASVPSGEPVVRCELVGSCRKCRHAVGRQSCALARRDIEGAGIPDWCPLPAYRAAAPAAPAPAPLPAGWRIEAMAPDGYAVHSPNGDCCIVDSGEIALRVAPTVVLAELCRDLLAAHAQAPAAPAPAPTVAELVAIELERLAQDQPISGNTLAQTRVLMTAANVREFGLSGGARTQAPAVAAPEPLTLSVIRDAAQDAREVFDAEGPETPQIVRDVIEYMASWLQVYADKRASLARGSE